jgi:hypothetical protein
MLLCGQERTATRQVADITVQSTIRSYRWIVNSLRAEHSCVVSIDWHKRIREIAILQSTVTFRIETSEYQLSVVYCENRKPQ